MKAYIWSILIWLDQGMNTIFAPILNLFVRDGGHRFGNPDETVSSVFGKNHNRKTCRLCSFLCRVIDHFDHGHCNRSIEADEGRPCQFNL